jgi:hypothetical protein
MQPVATEVEARVVQHVAGGCPLGDQLIGESREQLLQDLLSPRRQGMDMTAVGDAATMRRRLAQLVPVDHGHVLVGIGQNPCGEQPGHAGAQYHRAVSDLPVHRSRLLAPTIPKTVATPEMTVGTT